jgi:transcriptional regulator with XRE-family HTH domain
MPPERKIPARSPSHAALGQAIASVLAENADIDKYTLYRDAGLDTKQINALIRGTSNPQLSTLLRLADGLHVRLGALMMKADELGDKGLGAAAPPESEL